MKTSQWITGGTNGYPVPSIGLFYHADSIEELKEYENDELIIVRKRNGWDVVEVYVRPYDTEHAKELMEAIADEEREDPLFWEDETTVVYDVWTYMLGIAG
jgi:hypothetical protein